MHEADHRQPVMQFEQQMRGPLQRALAPQADDMVEQRHLLAPIDRRERTHDAGMVLRLHPYRLH